MKILLTVFLSVLLTVLTMTVFQDTFSRPRENQKIRQFVILVTPNGPVFGEATEKEDLMELLRKLSDSPAPVKNDRQTLPKDNSIDEKGNITF